MAGLQNLPPELLISVVHLDLPGTLFDLFCNFPVYIIDTLFILGDGLTLLLLRWYLLLQVLRWEKSAPLLSCSWIFLD
jgi:hypothetical protein